MSKRILSLLLTMTLLLSIPVLPASAQEEGEEVEAATIYLWTAWTPEAGIQEMIDRFNEIYPQIEVIPVQFSNNTDGNLKVDTTLAMGTGIDVVFNFGVDRVDARANAGLMLDLTPYIERDQFDVADQLGENIYTKDGQYYSLPATSNAYCVFLNKTMLEEAGLETPTSWTIDEYYEYARQLTHGEGDEKVYGSDSLRVLNQWLFMATNTFARNPWYTEDGRSNLGHEYFARALRLHQEAELEGIQYPYTEYVSSKISTQDNFLNGKAAMAIYGNSLARNLTDLEKYPHDFAVEVAPLPVMQEGDTNYNVGGYYGYLGINAKTQEPEASWLLLKFLVTEGSYGFLNVGHIPTWRYTQWDNVVSDMFGENAEQFINVDHFKQVILNQANMPQQVLDEFTAYTEITNIIAEEFEAYAFGISDLETTLQNVVNRSNEAIDAAQ